MNIDRNTLVNELLNMNCWVYIDDNHIEVRESPYYALKWLVDMKIEFKVVREKLIIFTGDLNV